MTKGYQFQLHLNPEQTHQAFRYAGICLFVYNDALAFRKKACIVKNHDVVVIEEIKTRNITRSAQGTVEKPGKNGAAKSGLNRAILDQGWHAFETMLASKLAWRIGELVKVRPHYPSQTCPVSGHCEKENRARQAVFQCRLCGHEDNADLNAGKNILAARHVASACGGELARDPRKQEACRTKLVSIHISSGIPVL
ncbi:MAG: zinc ribbon domain-containing protein [Fibrobacterota bacterium]|nr:zinc ribbon domain-containing protein [Fibrobacterota bacterium]